MTSPTEIKALMALKSVEGIGDMLIKNLVSYCGSPQAVFRENKSSLLRIPGIGEKTANALIEFKDFDRINKEWEFICSQHIKVHSYLEEGFPKRFTDIPDAPVLLYTSGKGNFNYNRGVAVVGTRKCSEYGRQMVKELIESLVPYQIVLISGLAMGIDAAAHKESLVKEIPNFGVLAHGLDRIYPFQNTALASRITENGLLVTEFMSGTVPDRENFPKRNRIVAALSDVIIVVETAIKGGARITAEIGNIYNRDVCAYPGRADDYYSQGCNMLIKEQKAQLITGGDDLAQWLRWKKGRSDVSQLKLINPLTDTGKRIARFLIEQKKSHLDDIAFELQIDPGELSLELLEMEMNNWVRTLPGKYFELINQKI